jgi:ATP-binding cassette subfamily B protein
MDRGRIAEQGTHEELLSNNGKYQAMWDMYTGSLEWRIKNAKGATANA